MEAVVVVDTDDDDDDEDTMSKNDFDDVEWIEEMNDETTMKMAVLPIEDPCLELPFWAVLDDSRLFAMG